MPSTQEPFEGKPMERVIWVTSPEGAEVYWSGKDAFKGLVPVVTMHAEGFDRAVGPFYFLECA